MKSTAAPNNSFKRILPLTATREGFACEPTYRLPLTVRPGLIYNVSLRQPGCR